jgi:thioredoxin
MAPILKRLDKEFDDQVIFAKVDVDNNQDLTEQFTIRSIPTLILFRNGKEWDRLSGLKSRAELEKMIRKMTR